jgi:hypothetical protein
MGKRDLRRAVIFQERHFKNKIKGRHYLKEKLARHIKN